MQWQIEPMAAVDSTNDVAREWVLASWARGETAHGLVITAQRQRSGRGQHGRTWESPPGGLYLSAVVEAVPVEARDRLALVAGAAAVEALRDPRVFFDAAEARGAAPVLVRWPNDLVVPAREAGPGVLPHRKVGGILCESVAMGERWASIVGIGINVTTEVAAFPEAMRLRATSLVAHDGVLRTVTGVLDALLESLAGALRWLPTEGIAGAVARLQGVDALRGRRVAVEVEGAPVEGVGVGIAADGGLQIDCGGLLRVLDRGSIVAVDGIPTRAS